MHSIVSALAGIEGAHRSRRFPVHVAIWLLAGLAAFGPALPIRAQVILTEFMANNDNVLADEDGDYEDWIEVYNTDTQAVDLAGWSLTDNAGDLAKWLFPSTHLEAGAYLVVFASGKNRRIPGEELHTNFKLSADGEYLALVEPGWTSIATDFGWEYPDQFSDVSFGLGARQTISELLSTNADGRVWVPSNGGLGSSWTANGFNDTAWTEVTNGVGYDTGVPDPAEDSYAASVVVTDPVLYWRLEETTSSTAANLGNFGSAAEGVYEGDAAQGIEGPRPPAFSGFEADNRATGFDGLDDYVGGPAGLLSDRGSFAMAGWIRPDAIGANRIGLFGQNDAIEFGFMGTVLNVWTPGGGSLSAPYPHPTGEWHHVLAQGTGQGLEIYVDGELAAASSGSTSSYGSSPYAFNVGGGGIWDAAGNHFPGSIDEVSVWHRALTSEEISSLLEQGPGPGIDYASFIASDIEAAMAGNNASAYLRFPFVVASPADIDQLALRMRYDDGFAAYLNGAEMATRNAPPSPAWNDAATSRHPDPSAVQFEEFDVSAVASFLVPGTNILAIQGLNIAATNSDFLIAAQLTGTEIGSLSTQGVYMTTATPGIDNVAGVDELGPLLADLAHAPVQPGDADDLLVTVRVTPTFSPVTGVTLHYRVMYAGEVDLAMNDSGTGGDEAGGDGIWSARIPASAASSGQMIRYYATSVDSGGRSSRWPLFPYPLDSEEYAGTVVADPSIVSSLPVLHQFIENPGAADTRTGTRCSLFYAGELYDNVRIDLHGQTTAGFPKKSYDVDFNRGHRFKALSDERRVKDIKLMSNWADKAKMRNDMAYDMIEAAGVDGHFCFQVRVQRNASFFNISDMMEDGDNRWMERLGRDPNGALYKMYNNLGSASAEKKTRKEEGSQDLQDLVNNLSEALPISDRAIYAYDNLDLPQTIGYFAGLALISSQDHGHKNYYMYRDSDGNGEWAILPWDVDLCLGRNWLDSTGYRSDTLYQDNVLDFYNPAQQAKGENRLYELIFDHPEFRSMYLRRLRTVMDTVLKAPGTPTADLVVESRIQEMMDLMDPPGVSPSDADLDYQGWSKWGTDYDMREDAERIINIHLPGRRTFLYHQGPTLRGEGIPAAQPADVSVTLGSVDYTPASGNQGEEYIELVNPNAFAVDISGWELGEAVRHRFRPGTVIPASSSLYASPNVVAFRARATGPGGGQGLYVQGDYSGQLNSWGETITLRDPSGRVVDTNQFVGTASLAQQHLRLTEIMYHPPTDDPLIDSGRFEFLEVKNVGPVPLDLTGVRLDRGVQFTFSGTLAPGELTLVVSDIAAFTSRYGGGLPVSGVYTGRLDNGGETVRLVDARGEKVVETDYNDSWYPITDGLGFSLETVDHLAPWSRWGKRSQWRSSGSPLGSPGVDGGPTTVAGILVNEALTHTDLPQVDTIELWNPTPDTVSVGGWYLTDDFYDPWKYRIPHGTTLAPGAYLKVVEPQFNPTPGVPPSFALSSTGDQIYLFSADSGPSLTGYVHGFDFGAAANGVSFGRHVSSEGKEHLVAQQATTLGGPNGLPLVGPVVISEIMYHPPDIGLEDDDLNEFIELHNTGSSPALLYDPAYPMNQWRLADGVEFDFPEATSLPAGGHLLVVGFDPADTDQADAFRATYGLPPWVVLYGPWKGKLDNSSETVALERPDTPNPDGVPYILVEQVGYEDTAPWPTEPDGVGTSLQRAQLSAFADDPANWFGSAPTPATDNVINQPPAVTLSDPADGARFPLPTNVQFSAEASDPDDSVSRVEFFAGAVKLGEDTTAPYAFVWTDPSPGTHVVTARAYDTRLASTVSTPATIHVTTPPPTVSLTYPGDGVILGDQENVLLQAEASVIHGSVVQVEFMANGGSLGIVPSPPYDIGWTASPTGDYAFTAVALNDSGLYSTSQVAGVTVVATTTGLHTLVSAGAVWRYKDDGSNQGTNWTSRTFDDSGWASGPAQLGYGDGDEGTVVEDGPDTNRFVTTYFRHAFVLPPDAQAAALEVRVVRDDGAILYLNDEEIFRQSMPDDPIDYRTYASVTASGADESTFFPQAVDVLTLVPGTNVLAAEIHQRNATSSDISFDAELVLTSTLRAPAVTGHPADVSTTEGSDATFSVTAEGGAPLGYQWTLDGVALPGATGPSLVLNNATPADAGSYAAEVTNRAGSATSRSALLTVEAAALPPEITSFLTVPGTGSFSLEWVSEPGRVYQVQVADVPNMAWGDDPDVAPVSATNTTASWTGLFPTGRVHAVYRVVVEP